jgi:acetyl esterase/lipase
MNTTEPQVIPLWTEGEIDTAGWDQPEGIAYTEHRLKVIRNVSRPTLTVFLPDPAKANGTAVIVCPGGAYHFLAFEHEGIEVARWLNARGIAAFMLKYRLVQTGDDFPRCVDEHLDNPRTMAEIENRIFPLITADSLQAIRLVRSRSAEWGINPQRIAVIC